MKVFDLYRGGKAFAGLCSAKARGKYIPWYLFLLVTEKCNMYCRYCYADIPARLKNTERRVKEWTTGEIFKIIDDFYAIGTRYLNIQGGEPLLRDDLEEIIDYANSKGMITDMFTNGLLIHKKLKALRKLSRVTISLEGDEKTHDKDRGAGTYKRITENMQLLYENDIKFSINYTVTSNNADVNAIRHVLELAKRYNSLVAVGEAVIKLDESLSDRLVPTERLRAFWEGVRRLKSEGYPLQKSLKSIDSCIETLDCVTGKDSYNEVDGLPYAKKIFPCAMGRYCAYLDTDGTLYPCANLFNKLGRNIFEVGAKKAWEDINGHVKCRACRDSITGGVNSFFAMDLDTIKEAARHFWDFYVRRPKNRSGGASGN
ncbi:MAG: radical SAM protein [Candidatus Omnitrophota bacterium]